MPFTKGTVPPRLADKGIPQRFIDVFINVFNSVMDKDNDEGKAYRQGYSVMNRELRKAGYRQGQDGKWHKASVKEAAEQDVLAFSAGAHGALALTEEKTYEVAIAEGVRFKGTALIDYAVAQQGTAYEHLFTPEFNDWCLKRTKEFMALGYKVTVYQTHGAAQGGFFQGSTEYPTGKVEKLYREGEHINYEAFISPTASGKDLIRLLYDDVLNPTSVRIYDYDMSEEEVLDAKGEKYGTMLVLSDGYIGGIDFCDVPGLAGAGVKQILEGATITHMEVEHMAMTMEELRDEPLFNEAVGEKVEVLTAQLTAVQAENAELKSKEEQALADSQAKVAELQVAIDALLAEKQALNEEVALYKMAATPVVNAIVTELRAVPTQERQDRFAGIRNQVIEAIVAEASGKDSGRGATTFGNPDKKTVASSEAEQMLDEELEGQLGEMARFMH